MSHIVQIEIQTTDVAAVRSAFERLGLQPPVQGTVELFSDQVTGLAVQLPGWHYPAVFLVRDWPGPLRQLWRLLGRPEGT